MIQAPVRVRGRPSRPSATPSGARDHRTSLTRGPGARASPSPLRRESRKGANTDRICIALRPRAISGEYHFAHEQHLRRRKAAGLSANAPMRTDGRPPVLDVLADHAETGRPKGRGLYLEQTRRDARLRVEVVDQSPR